MRQRPVFCTKPPPCDFDPPTAYCPHRECRLRQLELLAETIIPIEDQITIINALGFLVAWAYDEHKTLKTPITQEQFDADRKMLGEMDDKLRGIMERLKE